MRVLRDYESRQEVLHEGMSRVQREIDTLLRSLRERDQVLSRLCSSSSTSPETLPLPTTPTDQEPLHNRCVGEETGLRVSSQEEEVLVVDTPHEVSFSSNGGTGGQAIRNIVNQQPPAALPAPPPPSSLVDTNLIERARLLARNVDVLLGGGDEAKVAPLSLSLNGSSQTLAPPQPLPTPPIQSRDVGVGEGKEGDRYSNFIYGEIGMLSMLKLLSYTVAGMHGGGSGGGGRVFYDLGCGEGKTLLCARALGLFTKVVGIELIASLAEKAQDLVDIIQGVMNPVIEGEAGGGEIEARVLQEDFFSYDWSDGDVIYMCGTCFDAQQIHQLSQKVRTLKPGSRFILIDKTLPPMGGEDDNLMLTFRCQCHVSWGLATANVYTVISSSTN